MALDANSYGSVAGVLAYVRHMLRSGETTFTTTSRPTLAEVESFLNQRSAMLNACLAEAGYTVPVGVSYTQARYILDYYANVGAAGDAELTQRSAGTSAEAENDRENEFLKQFAAACPFIGSTAFSALGAPQTRPSGAIAGVAFGGKTRGGQALRPIFGRTAFGNNPTAESPSREVDYTDD
jgi:hypothetical protein